MTERHRILCIEDDARLRRLLVEDLVDAGYDAIAAANAQAGLSAFFTHAPSLVLCDIRMPGIDGFDLLERLRLLDANLHGAAFIFLTALADREHELRGRRLGVDDYITKPVDYDILHEVIRIRLGPRRPCPRPTPLSPQDAASLAEWCRPGARSTPPPGLKQRLSLQFVPESHQPPLTACAELIGPILDSMSLGVIILDDAAIIIYANESAAALLGRERVTLAATQAPPALAAFARRHAPCARISAARLPIGPGAGLVTALAERPRAGRTTILLPALSVARPAFGDILSTLFGLTPSERLLATEMGNGQKLTDIAATRGVTLATVRAQVRSIYDKVGVSKQTDLVREMLMLQMAVACTGP